MARGWGGWTKVGSNWIDGTEVIDGIQYDVNLDESSSAVVYGFWSKLYLFSTGSVDNVNAPARSSTGPRHYVNVFDGSNWSGWNELPDRGTNGFHDAAAVYNGKLYLFGIGPRDDGHYVNVLGGG